VCVCVCVGKTAHTHPHERSQSCGLESSVFPHRYICSNMGFFKVYHFLVLYVLATTGSLVEWHRRTTGAVSVPQVALAFFLSLNVLICLWEISLGWHIRKIKADYDKFNVHYKNNRMAACIRFFQTDLSLSRLFSGEFWSAVWSTYSLYDPSYSNKESFGFFIDVGNGWSTLVPSVLFCLSMTSPLLPGRVMGMIGLVKFYQVRTYSS
jgi:hypothetical protein